MTAEIQIVPRPREMTGDPDYYSAKNHDRVLVFLDGKELKQVYCCHTREGWAEVQVYDPQGRPRLTDDGERFLTEILRGAVTVEPMA